MADDAAAPGGELKESTSEAEGTEAEADSAAAEPESTATEVEASDAESTETEAETDEETADEKPAKPPMSHVRLATIAGLVLVLALGGLTGWLGFRAYESRKAEEQRNLYLQVGRQGALNLTTIDHQHADADVQRILDSATGTFYDDFQRRAQPFVDVVKQAQSKSVGTISEAGLESESESGDEAQVLVAVTVKTSNAGAPEQEPRAWRMRISVQKVGDEAKVANVEFVP